MTQTLGTPAPRRFTLALRLPGWCAAPTVAVNGTAVDTATAEQGYLRLDRDWRDGDTVTLDLPMEVRVLHADPRIRADRGRVALTRGPLVYCMEGTDNDGTLDMHLFTGADGATTAPLAALDGAVAVTLPMRRERAGADGLYRTAPPETETALGTFVPYHLWDNRDPGEMLVWLRRT